MNTILLKIKNLKKQYHTDNHTINALEDVNLSIYKKEIVSLLGVNGAGKTTLSSILATLHPPTSGDILFENQSIYKNINWFRYTVGFCPQKANLIDELTVEQNLTFAGRYYGIDKKATKNRVDELIQRYNLEKYRNLKPKILSGGYTHRVLIARALMHNPRFLILDEPTVGLDPHIRHKLWENIRDLKKEGVTILLTTHYLDEAEILSDRICILEKGKIKLIDTPDNLKKTYQKSRLEDVFIQLMEEETK